MASESNVRHWPALKRSAAPLPTLLAAVRLLSARLWPSAGRLVRASLLWTTLAICRALGWSSSLACPQTLRSALADTFGSRPAPQRTTLAICRALG